MPHPEPVSSRQTRLRTFRGHLICYAAIMAVLAVVNLVVMPETPWFIWPMVGWMAPLAIHAAFALGLFDKP